MISTDDSRLQEEPTSGDLWYSSDADLWLFIGYTRDQFYLWLSLYSKNVSRSYSPNKVLTRNFWNDKDFRFLGNLGDSDNDATVV